MADVLGGTGELLVPLTRLSKSTSPLLASVPNGLPSFKP
jgi:hypothetical protein